MSHEATARQTATAYAHHHHFLPADIITILAGWEPVDDTLPDPAQRMIATSNGVYADRLFPVEILSAAGECILADGPLGGSESATVGFQPCAEGMTTTVTPRQASDAALLLGDEETYRYCPTGLSNARMGALIALVAAAEALGA